MIAKIGCAFGRHRPDRRRIWHDSLDFRTTCTGCGRPMLRDTEGWRLFENGYDLHTSRTGKPGH